MKKKPEQAAKREAGPCLCQLAGQTLNEFLRGLTPPAEAQGHFQAACIELLKGLRSIIDGRIEHVSKHRAKGQKIRVD